MDLLSVEINVLLFIDGAILLLAADLDDLVFGQLEPAQHREAQRQTQPQLPFQ